MQIQLENRFLLQRICPFRRSPALRAAVGVGLALALLPNLPAAAAGITASDGRRIVIRGVGWSPWYPQSAWTRPEAVRDKEVQLLRAAHINTLRVWGPVSPKEAADWRVRGFYIINQVKNGWWKNRPVPLTRYADGKLHRFPPFSHPAVVSAFVDACKEHGRVQRNVPNLAATLLGNEFSWVGQNAKNQYVYAGFDRDTQQAFRVYLEKRFGSIEHLNQLCNGRFRDFDEVRPPGQYNLRYEWWRFLERGFERFMRAGYDAIKAEQPDTPVGYAKLMGRWDPCCEDAALSFLDFGGQNLYWHWDKDWAAFFLHYKQLVRHAAGKPVIITETGFRSGLTPQEEADAARKLRQELWLLYLQPPTAGVCVFTFNDEWWRDGNSTKRSPTETWGIVNAWREPKPAYPAVRDVYSAVKRLEPELASLRRGVPARVAVTCQDLDWAVAPDSGNRTRETVRFLASRGIEFDILYGADLERLPEGPWTHVIVCDAVLPSEPDGRQPAAEGLVSFLERGGRVLILSPHPFRTLYGKADLPGVLRRTAFTLGPGMRRTLKLGSGVIDFRPVRDLDAESAVRIIAPFVAAATGEVPSDQPVVRPREAALHVWVFFRTTPEGERILGVINTAEAPIESVVIPLKAAWTELLDPVYSDASTVTVGRDAVRITHLDAACVLLAGADGGRASPEKTPKRP